MDQSHLISEVELGIDSKALLESTKSTIHGVKDDVDDIGDTVDYTKMTMQQMSRELKFFRKESDLFRFEVRKIIADEIEKQVKPLAKQLEIFTNVKSKVVYIKWRFPFWKSISKAIYILINSLLFFPIWTINNSFVKMIRPGILI